MTGFAQQIVGSREAAGGWFKKISSLISTTPALRATPPHLRRGVLSRRQPWVVVPPLQYYTALSELANLPGPITKPLGQDGLGVLPKRRRGIVRFPDVSDVNGRGHLAY